MKKTSENRAHVFLNIPRNSGNVTIDDIAVMKSTINPRACMNRQRAFNARIKTEEDLSLESSKSTD